MDGIIRHPRQDPRTGRLVHRVFIPQKLRNKAIATAHTAGHVSYEVTLTTMENIVYWPSFRKDTRTFIDNCLICKEKSTASAKTSLGATPTPPHPWHTVGVDLLQLPVTAKENRYLMVLVDVLTRYAVAVPLKDKSAKQVASAFKRYILRDQLLGAPATILSDNGLEFVNQTLKRLFLRYGIKHALTAPITRGPMVPLRD